MHLVGLAWIGLDRLGLGRIGSNWLGLARIGSDWLGVGFHLNGLAWVGVVGFVRTGLKGGGWIGLDWMDCMDYID